MKRNCPDVACIEEQCAIELPEEPCPVLHVEVELHVASLVDEVNLTVLAGKASGTEPPDRPSPDTVGSTREIAFLEGQNIAVAIGIGYTETHMQDELVVIIKPDILGVFQVGFDILGIGDVEDLGISVLFLSGIQGLGKQVEHIARSLHCHLESITAVVVCPPHTKLHDEEVLIVVSENGIAIGVVLKIVVTEGVGYPRHEDVVEVEQVNPIAVMVVDIVPFVFPCQ